MSQSLAHGNIHSDPVTQSVGSGKPKLDSLQLLPCPVQCVQCMLLHYTTYATTISIEYPDDSQTFNARVGQLTLNTPSKACTYHFASFILKVFFMDVICKRPVHGIEDTLLHYATCTTILILQNIQIPCFATLDLQRINLRHFLDVICKCPVHGIQEYKSHYATCTTILTLQNIQISCLCYFGSSMHKSKTSCYKHTEKYLHIPYIQVLLFGH